MDFKIKTRKLKSYPGDKTIQIVAVRVKNGDRIGLMNLTPFWQKDYKKTMYESDVMGMSFDTITEAKQYCKDNLNFFINVE